MKGTCPAASRLFVHNLGSFSELSSEAECIRTSGAKARRRTPVLRAASARRSLRLINLTAGIEGDGARPASARV